MAPASLPPEVPPPRELRPSPEVPSFLEAQLLDQRVVRLWGRLDDNAISRACAELMALDATGDSAVQLYVSSCDAPLQNALSVIDTIDLLGVPVHISCLGRVEGAAVGIVAVGAKRLIAPHAQMHLNEPQVEVTGRASQFAAWAEHYHAQLDRYLARLAKATGRPVEHLEADMSFGRWLAPEEAVAYGLVDALWVPPDRAQRLPTDQERGSQPRRPFGFGPPREP